MSSASSPPVVRQVWQARSFGEPLHILARASLAIPQLRSDEVLISVAAIGLNFLDVLLCRGLYSAEAKPPLIPGAEVAGTVVAVGREVTSVKPNDRVCGLIPSGQGGFASAAVLPANAVLQIPDDIPFEDAAALVVTYHTAYVSLIRRAALRPGEWVLIHAGASGTGSAAIQIAAAQGAHVIATSRSETKAEVCRSLGADVVVNSTRERLVDATMRATDGRGADVILDLVGGEAFSQSLDCIAFEGRLLPVGWASGTPPQFVVDDLLRRNVALIGVSWGAEYPSAAPDVVQQTHAQIVGGYRRGWFRPLVREKRAFSEVPDALQALAEGAAVGKVVVTVDAATSSS